MVEHDEGAQEGAEEDAGDEGEGSNDEEGNVVLWGQRGLLALPEGLIPKGHDRVSVQQLWNSAEEQTLLWKRKTVLEGTLGSWERQGPGTGGTAGQHGTDGTRAGGQRPGSPTSPMPGHQEGER